MTRDHIVALVDSLVAQHRWGDISAARINRKYDEWAEALGPHNLADVLALVDFAVSEGRVGMITLGWLQRQLNHLEQRRAIEARTPQVECEACARLGGGRICDHHRDLGRRKINEIRRAHPNWSADHPSAHKIHALAY